MASVGRFIDYVTSYDVSAFKCIILDVESYFFTFRITGKDGDTHVYNYTVEELKDGTLYGKLIGNSDPKYEWKWYTAVLEDDIVVIYVCNDKIGLPVAELGEIFWKLPAKGEKKNYKAKEELKMYEKLIHSWGIKTPYTSAPECYKKYREKK